LARSERVIQILQVQREKKGYSQRALSASLGKDATTIGKLERGDRALSVADFFAICAALELSPTDVIKSASTD
jgi:transcriptional regulator with XRE-family HTH domain